MTPSFQVNWNYPTSVLVGAGRVEETAQVCLQYAMKNPLLITDSGLSHLPMTKKLQAQVRNSGLGCGIFSEIETNPNGSQVMQGVAAYQEGQHDGVIAFGGGSALDVAKAVALMVGQKRPLWDFEDIGCNWQRVREEGMATLIAIPTTAGTGSEMGRASVITDEEAQVKKIIFHPKMVPETVILDPDVTLGLPPHITAATGLDALSHNLEAYCAPGYHPMADGIAVEGIRLIKEYLLQAYDNGTDQKARLQMLVASSMGATAFQKGLGAMHALAHSLGALYGSHHGLLNAILMPYVLKANRSIIEQRIGRLALYLELPNPSFDGFLSWVNSLRKKCDIPQTLSDINIDANQSKLVAKMSMADAAAAGNPIQFSEQEYEALFLKALHGE